MPAKLQQSAGTLLVLRPKAPMNSLTTNFLISRDVDCSGDVCCNNINEGLSAVVSAHHQLFKDTPCSSVPAWSRSPLKVGRHDFLMTVERDLEGGRMLGAR